jgi:ABC-type phosphate transport system substrate-binding protein
LAAFASTASAQNATGFNVLGGGSSLAVNLYNRTAQAIATTNDVGANVLTQGLNTVGATPDTLVSPAVPAGLVATASNLDLIPVLGNPKMTAAENLAAYLTTVTSYTDSSGLVFVGPRATTTAIGAVTVTAASPAVAAVYSTTNQGEIGYQADGSGSGQKAMVLQSSSTHTNYSAGLPVAFGASDAYFDNSQIACWNGAAVSGATCGQTGTFSSGYSAPATAPIVKGGPLIQVPAFGTAIAIGHTNQYAKGISLDDNDLCGIFSGKITDWAATEGKPGSTAKAAQAGHITVVYRQDGSGTSFLFTQHLAKVCNTSNTAAGVTFVATKYFADVFGTPSVSGSNHFIGAGLTLAGASFIAASGSTGVADALTAGINLAGYITPDFTAIAPTALSHYAKVAAQLSTSITDTRVSPANSPYQYIKYAKVYNSHSAKFYQPNPGGASKGLSNPNTTDFSPGYPTTRTVALDPTQWVPAIADPIDGYPIVGYTTLSFATCYSSAKVSSYVKSFLTQLYGAGNKANLTAEGFTGVPSGYNKTIQSVFIKGTSTYGLNIGNSTLCNTSGISGTYSGL